MSTFKIRLARCTIFFYWRDSNLLQILSNVEYSISICSLSRDQHQICLVHGSSNRIPSLLFFLILNRNFHDACGSRFADWWLSFLKEVAACSGVFSQLKWYILNQWFFFVTVLITVLWFIVDASHRWTFTATVISFSRQSGTSLSSTCLPLLVDEVL